MVLWQYIAGSDPITGLLTYCEWLRKGKGDKHRRWCIENSLMHIRIERVHRLAKETAIKLSRHVKMPTFQVSRSPIVNEGNDLCLLKECSLS